MKTFPSVWGEVWSTTGFSTWTRLCLTHLCVSNLTNILLKHFLTVFPSLSAWLQKHWSVGRFPASRGYSVCQDDSSVQFPLCFKARVSVDYPVPLLASITSRSRKSWKTRIPLGSLFWKRRRQKTEHTSEPEPKTSFSSQIWPFS